MVHVDVNGHAGGMTDLAALLDDARATTEGLRRVLEGLDEPAWDAPTPAPGWTVRHQIRHLAHGDELAVLAATDETAFVRVLEELLADLDEVAAMVNAPVDEPAADLVARWLTGAGAVRDAVAAGPATEPVRWITGPMSRASFLTARVMETFAHGHDVAEAVGRPFADGPSLPHVAHLGYRTRAFAYTNAGLEPPPTDVRVELTEPSLVFGPEWAPDRIAGPARDFCFVVTRRRHRDDTTLTASGPHAEEWLAVAQCFAGPPSPGPPPGRR